MVWVQHSDEQLARDSDAWQYVPELVREDGEPLVHKHHGDSFDDTDLESVLTERGVGRLLVTGAQTDECIRSTLHGAFVRGYDTTLVGDAHTTEDLTEWGAPPAGQGHRPHQPLLAVPLGTGPDRRGREDRRGRVLSARRPAG